MDIVALIVLVAIAATGLVTPQEAISGFSSSAVITIWSMFILSAALTRTNAAAVLGRYVLNFAGNSEMGIILSIMIVSGLLSAFMNNIGVAALMLPVVMSVCRRTGNPPSRMLMPMAIGALLGGCTTMLATTNLLVTDYLRISGLTPFKLFDFFPVGIFVFTSGLLFVGVLGRLFLPKRDPKSETISSTAKLNEQYALQERTCVMKVRKGSSLIGKTLAHTNLGAAAGLTIFAVIRNGITQLAPDSDTVLLEGDQLIVGGKLERLNEFRGWLNLKIQNINVFSESIFTSEIKLAALIIREDSSLQDYTVHETNFRHKYGFNILAVKRGNEVIRTHISDLRLKPGDELLVQGKENNLAAISKSDEFLSYHTVDESELRNVFRVQEKTFVVKVPEDSKLIDQSLSKSRMGAIFGLRVIAIIRDDKPLVMPSPEELIKANDLLLIEGRIEDLEILNGLQELEIDTGSAPDISRLETEQIGLIEATLSPRSSLPGKTLRQIHFRGKYGLQVLAIWREGRAIRSNLRDIPLRFGDALLILGKHDKFKILMNDPDFIIFGGEIKEAPITNKAPVSALIMAGILTMVLIGLLPISIAAVLGVVLMILTKCLTMDEAYRSIDWRSVFLIAGMLPLGIAMHKTGAASLISSQVMLLADYWGPWGIITALYLLITISATVIPTSALVVLMSPIVFSISQDLNISVYTMMMMLAIAASASFLSPVSHPANVLVMGPGGYGFKDYMRIGIPLTIVVMIVALIMLSVFWPV